MNKLLVIPSDLEWVKKNNDYDGVILGIKDLSINLPFYVDIKEIEEIIDYINKSGKEIFISLNKNMHNNDIEFLKDTLLKLDKLNIKGILYYDACIVSLKNKLNLKTDLVWSQEHMTTNYYTANYWYDKKANYIYLSSEITLDEIKTIKENTKMKIMVNGFGYVPMFTSKRNLVKNYIKTFNVNDESDINYIYKEDKMYPIKDTYLGTTVYTDKPINVIKPLKDLEVDYIVINSFNIEKFNEILTLLKNNKDINLETSEYFLHKETVYKVKKND